MASETQQEPRSTEPPRRDHERSDVDVRAIALFGAGLIVLGVLIHFSLGAMLNVYTERQASHVGSTRPLSDTLGRTSQPALQVSPEEELAKLRSAEESVLTSYGWVDRKAGIVRIPIARAIDLLARNGLPVRATEESERLEKKVGEK
jgi:hypothetical protein